MKDRFIFILFFFFALNWACRTPAKIQMSTPASRLTAAFPENSGLPDTLHFFLPESASGNPVSDTLLKTALDTLQYENLHFGTGDAHFRALRKFPLTEDADACLLQTEEFWFGKLTLLLFDKKTGEFRSTVEVANFYGGDGGQQAVESWLFRNPAPPRLFVKSAEHGFSIRDGAEPAEYLHESGTLLQWKSKAFMPVANADSSMFLQKLKMKRAF